MSAAAESSALEAVDLLELPDDEAVVEVVKRWHDAEHRFAFHVCTEQPCHAIGRLL